MSSPSHSVRSCSSSGTRSPRASSRAGVRAWVSSIRASSPAVSGSPGTARRSRSVSRIASAARSRSSSCGPVAAVCPAVNVRYSTCRTACSLVGRSSRVGGSQPGAGRPDRGLGPADPLRHGGLGDQEHRSDLPRRQPGHRPQGQCDPGGLAQRRVGAQHQHRQGVVAAGQLALVLGGRRHQVGRGHLPRDVLLPGGVGPATTLLVDQPAGGDPDQPGAGVVRSACGGPLPGGREKCFLDGVLAGLEVAAAPKQGGQDVGRLVTPHV